MDAPPAPNGAALPWGSNAAQPAAQPAAAAPDGSAAASQPPAAGGRIEVLWEMKEDDGTTTIKWWGAVVEGPTGGHDAEGRPLVALRYDAYDEFEEERSIVAFRFGRWMADVSMQEGEGEAPLLRWRLPGEQVSDVEEEEEGEEEEEEGGVMNGQQMLDISHEMERQMGMTLDQAAWQQLQQRVPAPAAQAEVAARYAGFVDHFREQIQARMAASGGAPYTMTAADVNEIVRGMPGQQPGDGGQR